MPAEQRLAELESSLRDVGINADEVAPLLAPLLDIPLPPGRAPSLAPEEMRRRQLASIVSWVMAGARAQPLVLAFDDLQWADPTSIEVLGALAERGGQAPLFLIATSRPEFRPSWGMRSHHGIISLAPLDRAHVRQMVGEIASRHALSNDVVEWVSERTGGVPLFVEEVTRLILERGDQRGGAAIPLTLQQSLAARLDRLGAARETAQIGSVLGRGFAHALLQAVADLDETELQSTAAAALAAFDRGIVGENPYQIQYDLQDAMQDLVGIVRVESEMQQALDEIGKLRKRADQVGVAGNREYNNGWHTAIDLGNMLIVSEAVTRAALLRKESRGAQFREDFPTKDPEWGKYNIVIRRGADSAMLVEKRALAPLPGELKAVIDEMK